MYRDALYLLGCKWSASFENGVINQSYIFLDEHSFVGQPKGKFIIRVWYTNLIPAFVNSGATTIFYSLSDPRIFGRRSGIGVIDTFELNSIHCFVGHSMRQSRSWLQDERQEQCGYDRQEGLEDRGTVQLHETASLQMHSYQATLSFIY